MSYGTRLVFADLHNHSALSDGLGDPEDAFASMQRSGIEVAALTEHARLGAELRYSPCVEGSPGIACRAVLGIDHQAWQRLGELARRAAGPGFVAMRGFEWSSPSLGHVNVWSSEHRVDPLGSGGVSSRDVHLPWLAAAVASLHPSVVGLVNRLIDEGGCERASMDGLYRWLAAEPRRGGGADGIASFNHPGRDGGTFDGFAPASEPGVRDRVAAVEVFNRTEDYLFEGTDLGLASPVMTCLDRGWMTGLAGVSDEHGDAWGSREGVGCTGLWIRTPGLEGVREALKNRRFFATRTPGLRLDVTAEGTRMGRPLVRGPGTVRFEIDLDAGPQRWGEPVLLQVLGPGERMPSILACEAARIPTDREPVLAVTARIDPGVTPWAIVRVTDPSAPADHRATPPYSGLGVSLAYASPFFFRPARPG